jgi:hypothetical protein
MWCAHEGHLFGMHGCSAHSHGPIRGIWSISQRSSPMSRNERSSSALSSSMARRLSRHRPIMNHVLVMADLIVAGQPDGELTALAVGNERLARNVLLELACICVSIGNSRSRWTGEAASAMFPNHSDSEKKAYRRNASLKMRRCLADRLRRSVKRHALQNRPMMRSKGTIPVGASHRARAAQHRRCAT